MPNEHEDDDLPGERTSTTRHAVPEETQTAVPPPEPTPSRYQHSARLTQYARELGFSKDEIESTPTEALWTEVRNVQAIISEQRTSQTAVRSAPTTTVPAVDEEYDLGLEDEDSWDPAIIKAMKRIGAKTKKLETVEAELKSIKDRDSAREQNAAVAMVDDAFESLGEGYAKFFGEGAIAELENGSPEAIRRAAIFRAANIDFSKATPKSVKAAIRKAAETMYGPAVEEAKTATPSYGDLPSTPAKKMPAKDAANGRFTAKDFENGTTARATDRNGSTPTKGVQAAKEAVAARMREQGIDPGAMSSGDDDDDLM